MTEEGNLGAGPEDQDQPENPGDGRRAQDQPEVPRASVPSASRVVDKQLGFLAELTGTWKGTGFNVVALPAKHFNDPTKKFQLMVNSTRESFTFTQTGRIPNKGNLQDDIDLFGLQYLQTVDDLITSNPLHLEPGLWLNVPATTAPQAPPTVVRLSTIPHGDSLLAQGDAFEVPGGPQIGITDSIPFTLDPNTGARINDTNVDTYLKPYFDTPLPPGIPAGALLNPNVVLTAAIQGQTISNTVVLRVNASVVGGINNTPVTPKPSDVGGIVNIPFVVGNANANTMSAIFWIETVETSDGREILQLQYTQTVILDFPVLGSAGTMVDIKWPHISVATLIKQR